LGVRAVAADRWPILNRLEQKFMKTYTYYSAARNRSQSFQGDGLAMNGTIATISQESQVVGIINLAPGDYIQTLQPSTT
jgi:hypothetical protein